jgi:hypothetical protein
MNRGSNDAAFFKPGDLVEDTFSMRGKVAKVNTNTNTVWVYLGNGQMAMRPEELTLIHRDGMDDGPELIEEED